MEWLQRNAPSLAELYDGAVNLMFVTKVSGRVRFIAHAVREIRNRLPDAISGTRPGGNLQYKNRLDALAVVWTQAGLPGEGSLPNVALGGSSTLHAQSEEVSVSRRVFVAVAELVGDHLKAREKPEEAAVRLFEAVAPASRGLRNTLGPRIQQWLSVTEWFVKRAHDSGRIDAACDERELQEKFEVFETALSALVGKFFSTVKELDEILDDTNA